MGFLVVYGRTGVLLAGALLLSSAWMAALAVLQLHPTEVANYLMDTTQLDYGDFWILLPADNSIAAPAAVLLAGFSLGYFGLVVLMLYHSRKRSRNGFRVHHASEARWSSTTPLVPDTPSTRKLSVQVRASYRQLQLVAGSSAHTRVLRPADYRRQTWQHLRRDILPAFKLDDSPLTALPKLILQTTALVRFLEEGLPAAVIFSYAALLLVNWLITSYCSITRQVDPRLMIVRVFYSFDLFFAVLAPLQVLLYASSHFEFNRSEFATRTTTFATANFDRTARLFADPTDVSRFRIAFKLLQVTTFPNLAIKVVLNVFAILKWARVISLVARTEPGVSVGSPSVDSIGRPRRRRREWCLLGLAFFGLGGAVFVYTIVAVASTWHVCAPFVHCQVPSYHWNVGETQCSCLVFVDRQTRVTTFAEWQDPVDTSGNLAALAGAGYLKIVQIVNRRVEVLPEELRQCQDLEQLTLLYTKTTTIPDWAKAFTSLEYLHIEGDLMNRQLTRLPPDLFDSMPRLLFLHLGTLTKVPSIPELTQLHRLKYVLFAMLHSVTEIPSLDGLTNLQQLSIIDAIQVAALPTTHKLTKLRVYTVGSRMPVCCNGFITGMCDLTQFSCLDRTASGEPPVRCTRNRMTPTDYTTLMTTDGPVCDSSQKFDLKDVRPTVASVDLACGGVMYRQCTLNGSPGMCFPARMMPISCQLNTAFQSMRRLQIQRQVGEPCDAKVEAWLGCKS